MTATGSVYPRTQGESCSLSQRGRREDSNRPPEAKVPACPGSQTLSFSVTGALGSRLSRGERTARLSTAFTSDPRRPEDAERVA